MGMNKVLDMGLVRLWLDAGGLLSLNGFQISNDGTDVTGVKLEFRHVRTG